ncbi:DUF4129 domain-containing protein [Chitinophaga vietnamensis]|uniref:DUF4129 domain-containing protein n=1 Tax=Chitinophaga vietnamensis TaxID=2593957 RepID=UPI00117853C6|nr:DUF4129 domain-containing protein [Chitinophaga vietnamensis]
MKSKVIKSIWLLLMLCLPAAIFAQNREQQQVADSAEAAANKEIQQYIDSANLHPRQFQVDEAQDTVPADTDAVAGNNPNYQSGSVLPAYNNRPVSDIVLRELKDDPRLQYHPEEKKDTTPGFWTMLFAGIFRFIAQNIFFFRWIIILLIIGLIAYLLYVFLKRNGLSIFRKPVLIDGVEVVQEEELHHPAEYEEKIREAVQSGNIRQATRWWYLYTLFLLAGRELIKPGKEKTNNDYLRSMRNTSYYKAFAMLTMDYEYIWYGGFEVGEDDYRLIDQQFRDFVNQIGKAA